MTDEQPQPFTVPAQITDPCAAYLSTSIQIIRFFDDFRKVLLDRDLVIVAHYVAELRERQVTTTPSGEPIEDIERYAWEQYLSEARTMLHVFRDHELFLLQTMHARGYDAFLSYLADLLPLILQAYRARIDRSDDVLGEFIHPLIDQQLKQLTSSGGTDRLYKAY